MKKSITLFLIAMMAIFSSCSKQDPIQITPEKLIVNSEASSADVKTSGFINCEIIIAILECDKASVVLKKNEGDNKYKGEWFNLTISEDWKDLHFDFSENISKEDRSVTIVLSSGDITNQFTVKQKGTGK